MALVTTVITGSTLLVSSLLAVVFKFFMLKKIKEQHGPVAPRSEPVTPKSFHILPKSVLTLQIIAMMVGGNS
jgi:hypothetical protein